MIWAIVVMICAGAECRTVREMPMIDHDSFEECEDLRTEVSFTPLHGLRDDEHVETECREVRDRWTNPERALVVQL